MAIAAANLRMSSTQLRRDPFTSRSGGAGAPICARIIASSFGAQFTCMIGV
jgi:hypothetical protein